MAHIFLTGGTGFIGMHTLQKLILEDHSVTVLVRSQRKWQDICKRMNLDQAWVSGRIRPVTGDLSAPSLGLSQPDREWAETADVVIHAGGPMDILLGEDAARAAFFQAADEMLALAARIHAGRGLKHFIHLVGFKSPFDDDNFLEPEPMIARLEAMPPYERMKFLADLRVRQAARTHGFPLSVVNLSVVIGSSEHGDTPQTGGLGILVGSAARKLMRLVPGGGSHWLPLVHVDHAAEFISALACETQPDSATYFLMDERENSPTMLELGKHMAKELRVARPVGSIPPAFLSKVLDTPMGRKLGIPKESLDFIVNEEYPLSAAQKIRNRHGLSHKVKPDILPFIFADLDFRIVHPHVQPAGYIRGKRGPLASLERKGTDPGKQPIVFVHGLLSGADGLLPLAGQFPEADVCLVDLPGLGRSPYHHHPDVLEGHIEALVRAIRAFDTPVTLIGHSLGGLLAAKAWERVPECIGRLHLLQPVLHAAPMKYRSARLTEAALRRLTASGLQKQLLSQTCFESAGEIPPTYIPYVLEELRSPRVRKTTAEAFSTLTKTESFRVSPAALSRPEVQILWGTQDRVYRLPEPYRSSCVVTLPAAHHFPLSHPQRTASLLKQP